MDKTAVIVIDVQEGLFGATPPPDEADAVVDRINSLTAKARQTGVPVFLVQQDDLPGEDTLRPFSPGWQLYSRLNRTPGDHVVRKTTCDAFYRTSLEAGLKALGVNHLVLAGYATEFCVDATLRNAVSRDFAVTVAADAHTTHDGPVMKADVVREQHNWVWANCIASQPVRVVKAGEIAF